MSPPRILSIGDDGKVVVPLKVAGPAEAIRLSRAAAVQLAADLLATLMCPGCLQVHEIAEYALQLGIGPPSPHGGAPN